MKETSKMTRHMAKVKHKLLLVWFIDSNFVWSSIGKKFLSNGERYEGGFIEDKAYGQGKT